MSPLFSHKWHLWGRKSLSNSSFSFFPVLHPPLTVAFPFFLYCPVQSFLPRWCVSPKPYSLMKCTESMALLDLLSFFVLILIFDFWFALSAPPVIGFSFLELVCTCRQFFMNLGCFWRCLVAGVAGRPRSVFSGAAKGRQAGSGSPSRAGGDGRGPWGITGSGKTQPSYSGLKRQLSELFLRCFPMALGLV